MSGETVVALVTRPATTNADTIDALRAWLKMAEDGEIVGAAIVGLFPDGSTYRENTRSDNFMGLIGGLEMLKHVMIARALE